MPDQDCADSTDQCATACQTTSAAAKPAVSKRTKRLFIAFGALGLATIRMVWAPEIDKAFAKPEPARTHPAVPAPVKPAPVKPAR